MRVYVYVSSHVFSTIYFIMGYQQCKNPSVTCNRKGFSSSRNHIKEGGGKRGGFGLMQERYTCEIVKRGDARRENTL